MVAEVDIANQALQLIGTRSQIASLTENSNEAIQANLIFSRTRDELIRLAPWNCCTNYNNLALICAAPGTPENPTTGLTTWQKGIPPPPWAYEYAYPADCLRPLWVVPQFTTGFNSGVPILPTVTGAAQYFWNGPPVKFKVAIDQIGPQGVPVTGGQDTRVILTNQEYAILVYLKQVTDPDVWDSQFQSALAHVLAARLTIALTGDKALANMKLQQANEMVAIARQGDGNEGLTKNDVTPDFIRVRGITWNDGVGWTPNFMFDWGGGLAYY